MRGRPQPRPDEPFASLLGAAQAGGEWAFERLYRSLAPAVAGYLRAQGAAEPDDLTSEVFERAFTALGGFSGEEAQFRSWVFTIAHHRLTDDRRRAARRPVRAGGDVPETPSGDVEEEAARRLATERVRRLCNGLAPDQRDVLLLRMLAQGASVPVDPPPGRKKMLVKTVVGSLAAKLALGVGVATAGVTAAGAAGVLPDPAQHAVAAVVAAATPFAVPDPGVVTLPVTGGTSTTSSTSSTSTTVTTATTLATGRDREPGDIGGGAGADNHGGCVSAAAQDKSGPGTHGKTVSSVARSDCGKTGTAAPTTVEPRTTEPPSSSTTVAGGSTFSTSTSTAAAGADGRGAGSGRGNAGNANGGRGTSGND